MERNSFTVFGLMMLLGFVATVAITIIICWLSGWPILLETLKENLICYSVPLLELLTGLICLAIAGIYKLRIRG